MSLGVCAPPSLCGGGAALQRAFRRQRRCTVEQGLGLLRHAALLRHGLWLLLQLLFLWLGLRHGFRDGVKEWHVLYRLLQLSLEWLHQGLF